MPLFTERGSSVEDRGERVLFAKDPDTGNDVYLWIKPMPQYVSKMQNAAFLDRKKDFFQSGLSDLADPTIIEELLDRLAWSIKDSENFPIHIEDDGAAKFYRSELGSKAIKKGAPVILDGQWTPAIRERLVRRWDELADFVLQTTDEMLKQRRETQAARTKNLSNGSSGKSRRASRASRKRGAGAAKS